MTFTPGAFRGSIRTRYGGTLFRSKLEADWARFFDKIICPWHYEAEGRYYGDTFYLPDFFLAKSRQYVEVKGEWHPDDCRKVGALLTHLETRPYVTDGLPDIPVIACNPNGTFWGYRRPLPGEDPQQMDTLLLELNVPVVLFRCLLCSGWWFADESASWRCQCCGAYDGNAFLANRLTSPLAGWPVDVEHTW